MLDPRDERLVDGASRWMGLLGRFQVLSGGLVLLMVLGAALVLWLTDAMDTGDPGAASSPPLMTLGEVAPRTLGLVAAGLTVGGALFAWSGLLLVDASEDLEHHIRVKAGADLRILEDGLRRLGTYFAVESLFVAAALAALASLLVGAPS